MKSSAGKILGFIVFAGLAAALVYSFVERSKERAADEANDETITANFRVHREANGQRILSLDLPMQELIGLRTVKLEAATRQPEVRCYGRVLDPAPLVTQSGDVAAAGAAWEASDKEYQRLKKLFAEGQNTSARALEVAQAAAKRDRIALETARAELVAAWGEALADRPDLPRFVGSVSRREKVLVRLDLPAGETLPEAPASARLDIPGGSQTVNAALLGPAPTTDPLVQGQGYLFVATNSPTSLTPGLALTGQLRMPGKPVRGVVVPENAVVRSAGRAWVYVQARDTNFARCAIKLDLPVAGGWFVTNGVAPADRVVVTGAQTLLSEERKTEIKLED